jgi:serine-type D-Ala-D-Ala carboxypeptidase (penicillin-binding protein 5/6)
VNTRIRVAVAIALALLCAALAPTSALAASSPGLDVKAAWLMTTSGHVLYKYNSTKKRRVASTIKMLNAVTLMSTNPDLDEIVTVPAKAGRTPGIGIVKGEKFTLRNLLRMMLIASANDCAEAIAIHVGGTEKKYVAMMNAEAKKLGLKRTHAIDPHGLSKRERSTSHDLSVIATHLMADPVLRKIVHTRSVTATTVNGKQTLKHRNTDTLLGHYAGLIGIKTGFTNPAGYCFVGEAVRSKASLLSVVLGAKTTKARFDQTRKLMNWGFAGFKLRSLVSSASALGTVTVIGGVDATVGVHPSRDATGVVWTRTPRTLSVVLSDQATAPVHAGEQLGVVNVSQDATTLVSVPLVADVGVAATSTVTTTSARGSGGSTSVLGRFWAALMGGLHLRNAATGSAL